MCVMKRGGGWTKFFVFKECSKLKKAGDLINGSRSTSGITLHFLKVFVDGNIERERERKKNSIRLEITKDGWPGMLPACSDTTIKLTLSGAENLTAAQREAYRHVRRERSSDGGFSAANIIGIVRSRLSCRDNNVESGGDEQILALLETAERRQIMNIEAKVNFFFFK